MSFQRLTDMCTQLAMIQAKSVSLVFARLQGLGLITPGQSAAEIRSLSDLISKQELYDPIIRDAFCTVALGLADSLERGVQPWPGFGVIDGGKED